MGSRIGPPISSIKETVAGCKRWAAASTCDGASDRRRASRFSMPQLVSMETKTDAQELRIDHHSGWEEEPREWHFIDCGPDVFQTLHATPRNKKVLIQNGPLSVHTWCRQPYAVSQPWKPTAKRIRDTTASAVLNYFRALLPLAFNTFLRALVFPFKRTVLTTAWFRMNWQNQTKKKKVLSSVPKRGADASVMTVPIIVI